MPHPAHYFIKYLLVMQDDATLAVINGTLDLHGLAPVEEKEFGHIKTELGDLPEDFRGWSRGHRPTAKWLREQRIYSLFFPDEHTQEMRDQILLVPRKRKDIESLLLGNVNDREISYRLGKLGAPISEIAVGEFRHYFWNTSLMGLSDWATYFSLDDSPDGTGRTAATQPAYKAALNAGSEVALYRAGVRKELDNRKILSDIQQEMYYTFLEVRSLPLSTHKVEMLGILARGLAKVDERLQAGDSALADVLKKFEKFKVLSDQNKVPSLLDLAPTGTITNKSRTEILMTRDS